MAMPEPFDTSFSLCDLPDTALIVVFNHLGLIDRFALGCSCRRLRTAHQVSETGYGPPRSGAAQQQQQQQEHAAQRSHALLHGSWRAVLHFEAPREGEDVPRSTATAQGPAVAAVAAPPSPAFTLPRRGGGRCRSAIEYGSFFSPTVATLLSAQTLASDGRLTLLADAAGFVLKAHHPWPPLPAVPFAPGAAAATRNLPPPPLYDLRALPSAACAWLAPETPVWEHLAGASWPQPPVYRPPIVPPPPPPPPYVAPEPSHAARQVAPPGPHMSFPPQAGNIGCTAAPQPAVPAVQRPPSCQRLRCGWCSGKLLEDGLCEAGCGGGVAVLPAVHNSNCAKWAATLLASTVQLSEVEAAQSVAVHAAQGAGGGGGGGGGGGAPDTAGGGTLRRLTYLDCSYHGMYDGAEGEPFRAAIAAATAAATTVASTDGSGVSPLAAVLASKGPGRHLRHLVATRAATVGIPELQMLGTGDCCQWLVSLDLSGCPAAPAASNTPTAQPYLVSSTTTAAIRPSTAATAAAETAPTATVPPPRVEAREEAPATGGGSGSGGRSTGRASCRRRPHGTHAPPLLLPAGDVRRPAAAVVEFGRALRGAVRRLEALRVLRMCDLDLTGFFELDFVYRVNTVTIKAKAETDSSAKGAERPMGHNPMNHGLSCCLQPLSDLRCLHHLDLEGSSGWGPQQLSEVLRAATRLTHLGIARCRTLAYGNYFNHNHDRNGSSSGGDGTSSGCVGSRLRSLSAGWGFKAAPTLGAAGTTTANTTNTTVCRSSSVLLLPYGTSLTSLDLGVGSEVDDAGLAAVAAACPHLQQLRLALCGVGGGGLGALLAACTKVHVLHVMGCVGPFEREELLRPLGWLQPAANPALAAVTELCHGVRRWAMSDLRLIGGPMKLYDEDLLSLLYGHPVQVLCGDGKESCRTFVTDDGNDGDGCDNQTGGGVHEYGSSNDGGGVHRHRRRQLARLHTLALVGLPYLSAALLAHLRDYGTNVRHVRLEGCGYLPPPDSTITLTARDSGDGRSAATTGGGCCGGGGGGGGDMAGGGGGGGGAGPFTAAALLGWLERCEALENLRLRHCCRLGSDVVTRLTVACPALEVLMLDSCDLPPAGFTAGPNWYGALLYVMLARCRTDHMRLPVAMAPPPEGGAAVAAAVVAAAVAVAVDTRASTTDGSGGGGNVTSVTGDGASAGNSGYVEVGGGGVYGKPWWLPLERDVKVMRFRDGAIAKVPMF